MYISTERGCPVWLFLKLEVSLDVHFKCHWDRPTCEKKEEALSFWKLKYFCDVGLFHLAFESKCVDVKHVDVNEIF